MYIPNKPSPTIPPNPSSLTGASSALLVLGIGEVGSSDMIKHVPSKSSSMLVESRKPPAASKSSTKETRHKLDEVTMSNVEKISR